MAHVLGSDRAGVADLPLRLLAGVVLSSLAMTIAVAAAEGARTDARARQAREWLEALEERVGDAIDRPGSRLVFESGDDRLLRGAVLVVERLGEAQRALVGQVRMGDQTVASNLLCQGCSLESPGGAGLKEARVAVGPTLILGCSAPRVLVLEVAAGA